MQGAICKGIEPHCNRRSVRLHKYFGFNQVGVYEADEFGGLKNFKSILFLKHLK